MKTIRNITFLFATILMLSVLVTAEDCQCNSFDDGLNINSFLTTHGTALFYSDSMEAYSWMNSAGDKTFFLIDPSGSGSVSLKESQLFSEVATGTPPFVVASDTKVDNLNCDKLDGYNAEDLISQINSLKEQVEILQAKVNSIQREKSFNRWK